MGIYIEGNKLNFDRLNCCWNLKNIARVKQGLSYDLETNYITRAEYDKSISLIDNMK